MLLASLSFADGNSMAVGKPAIARGRSKLKRGETTTTECVLYQESPIVKMTNGLFESEGVEGMVVGRKRRRRMARTRRANGIGRCGQS